MEWVTGLRGKTVGVDSSPLIYFIEEHPKFGPVVDPFFEAVSRGEFDVVVSAITLLEVLVHPIRHGDVALAQKYNDILLSSPHVVTLPVTPRTAQTAAELRAHHGLKTPDAIQLASAVDQNAAAFLTNDRDFPAIDGLDLLRLHVLASA